MEKYICIHGHFYQPPRENPWLEEVEMQESAYPYHDWNERITLECYGPNTSARILNKKGRIDNIVNNYAKISFNFGPTLLSWMERHQPEVYQQILEADQLSRDQFSGHGSAIAQVYNHIIMPLANRRDKETQIIWGIRDFESRFKRPPEGMWLAEAAVDLETLELLAENQIKFTILDSHQAHKTKKIGGKTWHDVTGSKIDPRKPYLCQLPNGMSMVIFFYDGPIARDVAFSGVLNSGEDFARRLMQPFTEDGNMPAQLMHIATDGETYGHHHRYGEMALAYCLDYIEDKKLAHITIYGEYMEKFPPEDEVKVYENTSWSCFHGVERWRSDCGCNSGMQPAGWSQKWRAPLREALDYLRDDVGPWYEKTMSTYTSDPWMVRNHYIELVLDHSKKNLAHFLNQHFPDVHKAGDKTAILKMLEIQRHAMLMYTSCGWFFDELSGIESVQVLQYAARVVQLAQELFEVNLEGPFLELLGKAPSNILDFGNGVGVWEEAVRPDITDLAKVSANCAMTALFDGTLSQEQELYCYQAVPENHIHRQRGEEKLAIGKISVRSLITLEEEDLVYVVLHMGGHYLAGGVRSFINDAAFDLMKKEIDQAFEKGDIPGSMQLMVEHCGKHNYSLWHLFKDEQRRIFNYILNTAMEETEAYYRRIYIHHYPIIRLMSKSKVPLPNILSTTVEFVLNTDFATILEDDNFELEQLRHQVHEMKKWDFRRDKTNLNFVASKAVRKMMEGFQKQVTDIKLLKRVEGALELLGELNLDLDLWEAQNIYYALLKQYYLQFKRAGLDKNQTAQKWLNYFERLGRWLNVEYEPPQ